MDQAIPDLVISMLNGEWDPHDRQHLKKLQQPSHPIKLRRYHAGKSIYFVDSDSKYIYILLSGICHVISTSAEGRYSTIYVNTPPIVFGLTEALNDRRQYTASIIAASDCQLVEIPSDIFLNSIRNHPAVLFRLLQSQAATMEYSLNSIAQRLLFSKKEQLILYLYDSAVMSELPHSIPLSRPKLSALLGINLRTLYRYTDSLIALRALSTRDGKLCILCENWEVLQQLASKIYAAF